MQIIQLDECHSTQDSLKNQLREGELKGPACIYTHNQTSGRGRREKKWHHFKGSLAFSFVTPMFQPITFSPLAIGVVICETLESMGKTLRLKWPNDLVTEEGKKVGGILSEVFQDAQVLAGIGINLYPSELKSFDYPHGFLLNEDEEFDIEKFLTKLFENLSKRDRNFGTAWNQFCFHIGKEVVIVDQEPIQGTFESLGKSGEALIRLPSGELYPVFTGSLRFP